MKTLLIILTAWILGMTTSAMLFSEHGNVWPTVQWSEDTIKSDSGNWQYKECLYYYDVDEERETSATLRKIFCNPKTYDY